MSTPVQEWRPGMDITGGRLQYMLERLAESITVKAYGATGDGTTDDAPAIQSALNYCRDHGGGWVVVPPGTYLLSTLPLRIYKNTRLTLLPGAEFRRNADQTLLLNGDANQNYGGYTGHGNILVEGGLWNMQATTTGLTASRMCMSFGHGYDITVRDLEIRDTPGFHAIEVNATKGVRIERCSFKGFVDPGGRDLSEAVQIDLAKDSGAFGGFGPYDNTVCLDVLVQGCYFGTSGTSGTTAWPRGVGSHSATVDVWHRRIRIIGNSFEGMLQYGVRAYNWEDVTIGNNVFNGCGSGVSVRSIIATDTGDTTNTSGVQTNASQKLKNVAISGNTFRAGGSYDDAIVAYGETSGIIYHLAITGNTIDTTGGSENGIRLYNVERVTVSGNVISSAAGTGISTENANNMTLTGNVVWTPGARGITCVSSDNSSIIGNQVRDAANEGILLQTSSYIQVRDNYIRGASTASNGGYSGIRLSASQNAIVISGNCVRPNSANTNKMSYGLSIDSTCTNISRWGNDCRQLGGTNVNGSISDTVASTAATDLT